MASRRRARGLDDELVEMFAELPWWSVPIATAAVFLTMAGLLPALFPARTAADRVSIGHLVGVASYGGGRRRGPRRTPWARRAAGPTPAATGLRAESGSRPRPGAWLARLRALGGGGLPPQGFEVTETADGADGDVDLILRRGGETTYIQCKHWRVTKVDVRPLRKLYGVMAAGGAARGALITDGSFTSAARSEASDKSVQLIGGATCSACWVTRLMPARNSAPLTHDGWARPQLSSMRQGDDRPPGSAWPHSGRALLGPPRFSGLSRHPRAERLARAVGPDTTAEGGGGEWSPAGGANGGCARQRVQAAPRRAGDRSSRRPCRQP